MANQTGEKLTTGLRQAWSWLRGFFADSQTRVWAVSYWPILAGILVAMPFVFMPAIFGFSAWTYLVTVPIGIGAGFVGYGAAFLAMGE